MIARINGSEHLIEGSAESIVHTICQSLASSREEALWRFFQNLADFYEGVDTPSLSSISSNYQYYAQYAFTLSVHFGHLILEGENSK